MTRYLAASIVLFCITAAAQQKPLTGAIDIHVHTTPDSLPRSIDAIDLARLAKAEGMRAIVLKNHFVPTANDAYLVRKAVPGIEIFGGIDLNLTVGGMNAAAVENMAKITGHYGRVVWMASFDSCAQVRAAKEDRPCAAVSRDGKLLPETMKVIDVIAKSNLVMETGHNTAEECLMMIRYARQAGVKHIVVTHAMLTPIHMSIAQMKEAAAMGAYIEFVYNGLVGGAKEFEFADYVRAMRSVGAEHCILSSDMGQAANPVHTEGLKILYAGLLKAGMTQNEIAQMSRGNPSALLELTPVHLLSSMSSLSMPWTLR
jgi:hypothetical protein